MKLAWLGVVAFCGTAAADPVLLEDNVPAAPEQAPHPLTIEVGPMVGHLRLYWAGEPASNATVESFHFAPRIAISRYLYAAINIDFGRFSTTGPLEGTSMGALPPGDPALGMQTAINGLFTQVTGSLGAHAFEGPFSGNLEAAVGGRIIGTHNATESTLGQTFTDAVGIVRAGIDWWATPRLTLGALAELDVQDVHDYNFGVMLGFHLMPYDAAR